MRLVISPPPPNRSLRGPWLILIEPSVIETSSFEQMENPFLSSRYLHSDSSVEFPLNSSDQTSLYPGGCAPNREFDSNIEATKKKESLFVFIINAQEKEVRLVFSYEDWFRM